jgi:hypothetical protein
MKKRVGLAYVASVSLAAAAFVLLMLKVLGPSTRWAAASLYLLAWVLLIYAVRRHARAQQHVSRGARWAQQLWSQWYQEIVAGAALALLGTLGLILAPPTDAAFLMLPAAATQALVSRDFERTLRAGAELDQQTQTVLQLFSEKNPTSAPDAKELRAAWAVYVDYAVELDQLVDVHEHFYQINPVQLPKERARSFLIAFAALSAQLHSGYKLRPALVESTELRSLLNEPSAEHGLPSGTCFAMVQALTRPDALVRLQAGLAYLAVLRGEGHFGQGPDAELAARAQTRALETTIAFGSNAGALIDNPLSYLEAKAFDAWFPLQRKVATDLGDLRVQQRDNFIDLDTLQRLKPQLEPMDVMLERRNWYATNVGLPGFWPHAALFIGELSSLDAYFEPALVEAATQYPSLSAFLQSKLPELFKAFAERDEHNHPMGVLEAVSEGVVLQSFEHSGQADYLAVLRPRLDKAEKLNALLRAFGHHLKPYDFDFDFVTDEALVCSELVFKSLDGVGPLHFALEQSSGRKVLTPNQIARKFDDECDQPNPSFTFVAFLDGSEQQQRAFERDAATFRGSWKRPKWDVAQP